jgi:hypothetical protein
MQREEGTKRDFEAHVGSTECPFLIITPSSILLLSLSLNLAASTPWYLFIRYTRIIHYIVILAT